MAAHGFQIPALHHGHFRLRDAHAGLRHARQGWGMRAGSGTCASNTCRMVRASSAMLREVEPGRTR